MKQFTLLLLSFLLFISTTTQAQREYWGLTSQGGKNFVFVPQVGITNYGLGVIFKTDKYGHNQQVAYNFDTATGFKPIGSLTQAGNGMLYGFATEGGGGGDTTGCFFEFDPKTYNYRIIKYFLFPGGYTSNKANFNGGTPLLASNGKIYGLSYTGNWICKLFEYDPATNVYIDKYTFNQTSYLRPLQGFNQLMQAANGKIYINFRDGCILAYTLFGEMYEYNPVNNTMLLKYSFTNNNGSAPGGPFLEYSPGVFYSTFTNAYNTALAKGGIHKYEAATNTFTMVARFDTIDGFVPLCTMIRVGNKLYGTTQQGGIVSGGLSGILFEFDPTTNKLLKLWEFGGLGYPDPLLNGVNPGATYSDYIGWGAKLFATNDTLWGLTNWSMFYYKISTGEFKSLFGLTSYKGTTPKYTTLTQTCTKPYYKTPTQDTINVPIGTSFNYNIHSPNSTGFQWIKDGANLSDVDSTLSFNPFNFSDTGSYTCHLSNECGDTTTKAIFLTAHILPVNLLLFKATLQNLQTHLKWTTAQEINNRHFIVERSPTGNSFISIGKVNGHGTTTQQNSYQYTDENTPEGISYYRLQQVDYDGKLTYSNIEMVNKTGNSDFTITPNPANNKVQITFIKNEPIAKLEWIGANGQVVQINEYKNIRLQTIAINRLASGVYTLRVTTKNGVENRQMVVEHE